MYADQDVSLNNNRNDPYHLLLREIVNYQKALQEPIAKQQLDNISPEKQDYWRDYLLIVIPKLLGKKSLISISNTQCLLKRHINALLRIDSLYIDDDGEIMVDNS